MKALTNMFTNSHLHLWICDSIICGSRNLKHFSQLRCCVNIWRYQKKIIKNLTVNYISFVVWRTNQDIQPITRGLWWAKGWEQAPCTFLEIWHYSSVLRLVLPSRVQLNMNSSAVHEYIFVYQDHSARSNDQTPSDYYLFWNLKSDHCGSCYAPVSYTHLTLPTNREV